MVGVYRPVGPSGSFWERWDLFQFGQRGSDNKPPPGDASFVAAAALSSRLQQVPQSLSADVAVLTRKVQERPHVRGLPVEVYRHQGLESSTGTLIDQPRTAPLACAR